MEYYGNRLCVSYTELATNIMSAENVRQLTARKQIERVRRGCNGKPALFAVDSLPLKYRTEVYKRYPDAQEKADSKPFIEAIEVDGAAVAYYSDYVLEDGRHLPNDKQQEYANNAAIMRAFGQCIERANSHRTKQSKPKIKLGEFWTKAAAALPRIGDKWPNSLPQNARRLSAKWNEYKAQGYDCFISKKWQNSNAAKIDTFEKEAVLMQAVSHKNSLDDVKVAGYYNQVAVQMGWPTINARTVCVWREKRDLITSAGRRGANNFRNERSMQVKRSRPTAAFYLWSLDGWDVELLYQSVKTDKKGRNVTTYSNRLAMVVVLDPCCDYPIGYAIGTHETPELIAAALRNAAQHSQELTGQMLRSNQIQCDHYAIKAMTPLYQIMGDKVTPARVKNAKAKPVEAYFKYLNTEYCQRFNNWSGYGITTDPKKQPNSEALNLIRHSFPDIDGVMKQIHAIMSMERHRKHDQFMQFVAKLPQDRTLPLSKENYLFYYGNTTGHTNAICGGGLRPTLLGCKRDYDTFDISFRQHAGEKWTVLYDPDNLSEVLAVNEDGTLRYMLQEKYVQPMALADRKAGDAEQLQKVFDYNKRLEDHVTDKLTQYAETIDTLIADNPNAKNLLTRHCLLDSKGQHKLPREQKRLGIEEADAVEIAPVRQYVQVEETNDYSIF